MIYVNTQHLRVVASLPVLRETFRYWILSFLSQSVEVDTAGFSDRDAKSMSPFLHVLLIFGESDLDAAMGWLERFRQAGLSRPDTLAIFSDGMLQYCLEPEAGTFGSCVPLYSCMQRITAVVQGEPLWHLESAVKESHGTQLTKRELQVLELVARGAPLKEIAYRLGISKHTVVAYRRSLYLKTGARTLQQLALYATLHVHATMGSD